MALQRYYGSAEKYIESLAEQNPNVLKLLYPRVYENTGAYYSPKLAANYLTVALTQTMRIGYDNSGSTYQVLLPSYEKLIQHQVPTFFIAPDLLEAVRQTDIDMDIAWPEIRLPYEAGLFMMPRGGLVHPVEKDVAFILWCRTHEGDPLRVPLLGDTLFHYGNTAFTIVCLTADRGVWFDSVLNAKVRPMLRLGNLFYRAPGEPTPCHVTKEDMMPWQVPLEEVDAEWLEEVGRVVFGTFLIMNARPELVERSRLVRKLPESKGGREFWSPNIIGRRYKIKREVPRVGPDGKFIITQREHGTHASPRAHWRRGHMRQQPIGTGRKERKEIWIEPVFVCGSNLEAIDSASRTG